MQTSDRNRLVREYSHKKLFFVLFCLCLCSCFSWKQTLRTKERPETKTPEASTAQQGLGAHRTGFSAVGWMGPERLRSCPHLQRSETGGCLCRHESPSSGSMDGGQGSGWQGGGLWGRFCTDGSIPYSRDSEGGIPGRDMNNKPELRCGGGLNKNQPTKQLLCAVHESPPLWQAAITAARPLQPRPHHPSLEVHKPFFFSPQKGWRGPLWFHRS